MNRNKWFAILGIVVLSGMLAYGYSDEPTPVLLQVAEPDVRVGHSSTVSSVGSPPASAASSASAPATSRNAIDWISQLARSSKPTDWLTAHKAVHLCILSESLKRSNPGMGSSGNVVDFSGHVIDCDKVTAEQRRDYMTWLNNAVASEVPGALQQRWVAGPNGNPDDLILRRDDPLVQAWMKETTSLLEAAGAKGDVEAIAGLSTIYASGSIAPSNPARGAMLDIVVLKIKEAQLGRPAPLFRQVVEAHRRQFSPEEMRVLEAQADAFYIDCCRKK